MLFNVSWSEEYFNFKKGNNDDLVYPLPFVKFRTYFYSRVFTHRTYLRRNRPKKIHQKVLLSNVLFYIK